MVWSSSVFPWGRKDNAAHIRIMTMMITNIPYAADLAGWKSKVVDLCFSSSDNHITRMMILSRIYNIGFKPICIGVYVHWCRVIAVSIWLSERIPVRGCGVGSSFNPSLPSLSGWYHRRTVSILSYLRSSARACQRWSWERWYACGSPWWSGRSPIWRILCLYLSPMDHRWTNPL